MQPNPPGRPTRYPGKDAGRPTSITLTPTGWSLWMAIKSQTGMSGSDIVETLLRRYGGTLLRPAPATDPERGQPVASVPA